MYKRFKESYYQPVIKKVAFCFLIYDKINHEKLWADWLKNVDSSKYNISIHYKEDKPLNYFNDKKLKNVVKTKWCDKSLVIAQNLLIDEMMKDRAITHFIFLSDSCIPVKSFNTVYNSLSPNFSYFNLAKNNFIPSFDNIPVYKSSQWCILSRQHAEMIQISNLDNIFKFFPPKSHFCADEYVYLSLLMHFNQEKQLYLSDNSSSTATTFIGWKNMKDYKEFPNSIKIKQPNNYTHISKEELIYMIQQPCLFARKFKENCTGLENLLDYL